MTQFNSNHAIYSRCLRRMETQPRIAWARPFPLMERGRGRPVWRNRWILGVALGLPCCGGVAWGHGVERTTVQQSPTPTITRPFSWYTQEKAPLKLKGRSAAGDITFMIANRKDVISMQAHLLGVNSDALLKGQSQLLLELNEHLVKQIPLDGQSTKIDETVSLPPEDLRDGSNQLTLSVIQKAGQNCESFDDPRLWTRISLKSTLTTTYRVAQQAPMLADLRPMVIESQAKRAKVLILYDKAQAHMPEPIIAVAQSVGRLDDPVSVSVVARPLDNLEKAITQAFPGLVVMLEQQEQPQQAAKANRVKLSVERNAVGGLVLTIAGDTPHALAVAARMIGSKGVVWPNATSATVVVPTPRVRKPDAGETGDQSKNISFLAAGMPTQMEQGRSSQFAPVTFWNPNWDSHAILYLHLTYSAGGGPGSMVQALVNGKMVNTIPLTNQTGGTYPDYKLLIPQDALKVGRNTLVLKPVFNMQRAANGACTANNFGKDLGVTIFSDSHLSIIGGAPVGKSDLAAMSTGIYYVHTIAITRTTPDMISAAATLGAKLAEIAPRYPVHLLWQRHPVAEAGTLVLGPAPDMPRNLLMDAGIYRDRNSFAVKEPSDQEPSVPGGGEFHAATAWLSQIFEKKADSANMGGATSSRPSPSPKAIVRGFGHTAVMAIADAHDASAAPGLLAPATVLTAQDDKQLDRAVDTLVEVPVWRQLAGQAVVITADDTTLQVMPATHVPASAPARLGFIATRNPLETVLAVLGALVLLILLIRGFVSLRRRRLHPNVKGVDER